MSNTAKTRSVKIASRLSDCFLLTQKRIGSPPVRTTPQENNPCNRTQHGQSDKQNDAQRNPDAL